jgi:hypothetical protein
MSAPRPSYGHLVSAIGAAVLAVAVFLPWYGVAITQTGIETAQQGITSAAQQYGNPQLQSLANEVSGQFGALAGHQLGTVSAHEALKVLGYVLLALAAVGLLAAVMSLAGAARVGRGQLALLGGISAALVAFRMAAPPAPAEPVFTLSVQWGAWLALAGAVAIVVGDLWPAGERPDISVTDQAKAFERLSGWTPSS